MESLTSKRAAYLRATVGSIQTPPSTGPRGGNNVRNLPGWSCMGHAGWTNAAIAAGYQARKWWSGSCPTPSTAFPTPVVKAARNAPDDLKWP